MAPTMKTSTMNRVIKMMNNKISKDKKNKIKPKSEDKVSSKRNSYDEKNDDLMSPEDEKLLDGIDESDDGTDVEEISSEGDDIDASEITAFIDKLGVAKHRPSINGHNASEDEDHSISDDEGDYTSEDEDIIKATLQKKQVKDKKQASKKNNTDTEKQMPRKEHLNTKTKDISTPKSAIKYLQTYKSRKYLLIKEGEMWREEKAKPCEACGEAAVVAEAERLAQRLMQDEVAVYSKQRGKNSRSDDQWQKTVMKSGTLTDKMAALTLAVHESPLHNLPVLDTLVAMACKKGRREAMMAVDTLRDLYLTGLLPDDRKLRPFNEHEFLSLESEAQHNVDRRDRLLLMWHYEAQLKLKYIQYIKAVGEMLSDTLLATKEKAIATVFRLLSSKPEQEHMLLPMLVNKLGDPTVKSKAMYLLTKLVEEHPKMAAVIVREVKQLMHRPNVSARAQYYAICFLSQLRLSARSADLATELITIYFFFFQTELQKGQVDNKMMSALLSGVNRAYVYAKGDKQSLQQQVDAMYKILPQVAFHTGVQTLTLLLQVTEPGANASDRYYMNLYRKLGDPELRNSSKQAIFMNLIFKSLKRDPVDRRIKAFIKRILQVYGQQPPQVLCAILIILSQILKEKPGLIDFKHIAMGDWEDDEEEKFVDLPDPDEEPERNQETEENNEMKETQEKVENSVKDAPNGIQTSGPVQSGQTSQTGKNGQTAQNGPSGQSSWVHRNNTWGGGKTSSYDPLCRNPLYCRAEADLVWELTQLTQHYHPSVRLYADNILAGDTINYDGDPLKDFTLIRFLDKFVYKNPKKQLESRPSSGQHLQHRGGNSGLSQSVPVNSEKFLSMEEAQVPEGDRFFYRYFVERAKRKKEDDTASDAGSVDDDEFDRYLAGDEKEADDIGDDDEFGLDFARDKNKSKGQRKGQKEEPPSEDEDDEEDDIDITDDELAGEFAEEMAGLEEDSDSELPDFGDDDGADFQDSDISDSDGEEDELKSMMKQGVKRKRKGSDHELPKNQKNKKRDTQSLFASAEEFAHLLEEGTEEGKVSLGGVDDVQIQDKADMKQLKWELDRDRRWNLESRSKGNKGQKKNNFKKKGNDGRGGNKVGSRTKNLPSNLKKRGKASKQGKPKHGKGKSRR